MNNTHLPFVTLAMVDHIEPAFVELHPLAASAVASFEEGYISACDSIDYMNDRNDGTLNAYMAHASECTALQGLDVADTAAPDYNDEVWFIIGDNIATLDAFRYLSTV